jgi:hypothetical protein
MTPVTKVILRRSSGATVSVLATAPDKTNTSRFHAHAGRVLELARQRIKKRPSDADKIPASIFRLGWRIATQRRRAANRK